MSLTLATAAHHSFWSSTLALVLVAGVCALMIGAAVALILSRRFGRGTLRERVGEFLSPPIEAVDASSIPDPITSRAVSGPERSLERERWWGEFKQKLDIARIDRPAIEVVYVTLGCTLVGAFLFTTFTGTPIAGLAVLIIGPLIARAFINWRVQRQRILFAEQLPAHLQELAAAMRAGHSMISGIGVMADGASEPTQSEFRRVLADEQLGLQLDEALRSVAARMNAQDMEQVALVAELHRQTGGNMAEVLDRVAEAVRERAELNRELRTLTAQARGSRWIVTLMPPALLIVIDLLNPGYLKPLFHTATGNFLLGVAAVLILAGSFVMGRIIRIEV